MVGSVPNNQNRVSRSKLAAIIFSLPSWGLILASILYPDWRDWAGDVFLPVFFVGVACYLCTLFSLTLLLILSASSERVSPILFLWDAIPILLCLAMLVPKIPVLAGWIGEIIAVVILKIILGQ
ncbi:MAG TPA: hypothetical protein VGO57_07310 [Verrucomicrobiae bacterium]|jgi:hypothetical protein